jgi:hypothetical protein
VRLHQGGELCRRGCGDPVLARHDPQRLDKGCAVGEALLRALGEYTRHDYVQLVRLRRVDFRGWRGRILGVSDDQLRCGAGERHFAGDNLVGGDA